MMEYIKLNNGVQMPQLGFGVFQIDDLATCRQAVSNAINVGYRLFDTAATYGNEQAVGQAIKESGIPRDQFFITSKMWISDTQGADPVTAIDRSLHNLGTDYLDLYLIHMPYGDTFNAWRAMETAYRAGKIRAIGVSNFSSDQLTNLQLFNQVQPAVNQIEINPWNQNHSIVDFCQSQGIQPEAWAPFAEGHHKLFHNETLAKIAHHHQRSVGQVILRWLLQRGIVVIPKSTHRKRMIENLNVFDFSLSMEEMTTIKALARSHSDFFDPHDPAAIKAIVSGGRPGANENQ